MAARYSFQQGLSFIELIAVLVIASLLFAVSYQYYTATNLSLTQTRHDVVAALIEARQLAVARGVAGYQVRVLVAADTIDVQENNVSISTSDNRYPLVLPADTRIISGVGMILFGLDGEVTASRLVINRGQDRVSVNINGLGYVN